jgi:hypothetical protein
MAALLDTDAWHAIDAPFTDLDAWLENLEFGVCMGCGGEACRGEVRWWHDDGTRVCPAPTSRRRGFSPDPDD